MSTQIDLGPVLSIPKGDWDVSTTYERLNLVRHNSAAWICNVATSKGVEPTEDSTDWFLQVKDTSSVSSVNGMKGDVEITTIQTPSNDSDDASIANTEWVRDRIDETINSTHSYTDSAVSTATTSILDTAAQDASNKATIAVNQALAASEAKFAAKEIVNNLADNVSTLTENDVAQDKAIDGKLDKSGGTMTDELLSSVSNEGKTNFGGATKEQVVVVSAGPDGIYGSPSTTYFPYNHPDYPGYVRVRANNQQRGYDLWLRTDGTASWDGNDILTSAGGTMTGAFVNATLTRNNLSGQTEIYGGTTGSNGAYIALYGQSCTDGYGSGKLLLRAANKGTKTDVTIDPGRGMYVDGNAVITSAGGEMTGGIRVSDTADFIRREVNNDRLVFLGGPHWERCSYIELFGGDNTGRIQLNARDGTNGSYLVLNPDGWVGINGSSIITLVASWTSGANWYRKYNDGWIEQGGYVAKSTVPHAYVGYHLPFANTNYFFTSSATPGSIDASGGDGHQNRSTTGCTILHTAFYHNGAGAFWYACGY